MHCTQHGSKKTAVPWIYIYQGASATNGEVASNHPSAGVGFRIRGAGQGMGGGGTGAAVGFVVACALPLRTDAQWSGASAFCKIQSCIALVASVFLAPSSAANSVHRERAMACY